MIFIQSAPWYVHGLQAFAPFLSPYTFPHTQNQPNFLEKLAEGLRAIGGFDQSFPVQRCPVSLEDTKSIRRGGIFHKAAQHGIEPESQRYHSPIMMLEPDTSGSNVSVGSPDSQVGSACEEPLRRTRQDFSPVVHFRSLTFSLSCSVAFLCD